MNDVLREKVMAFSDGELPFEQWRDVLEEVVDDPDLLRYLNVCRFTRELRRVFDRELIGGTPERLLAAINQWNTSSSAGARISANNNTPSLTRLTGRFRMPAWALAAAAALVVGASTGWFAQQALRENFTTLEVRGLVASVALQTVLDTTPSGKTANVARDLSLKPVMSFPSQNGKWCRQYELGHGGNLRSVGLACRSDDGTWTVQAQTAATPSIGEQNYKYVGENDRIIEGVRTQIIEGETLTGPEESEQIAGKWQRKP